MIGPIGAKGLLPAPLITHTDAPLLHFSFNQQNCHSQLRPRLRLPLRSPASCFAHGEFMIGLFDASRPIGDEGFVVPAVGPFFASGVGAVAST